MAAQVNNVQPFVSSSAYYGYMPINHHQQQQQQQTQIFNAAGMDVDNESFANAQNNNNNNNNNNVMQQKQPTHEFLMSVDEGHRRWSQGRKRGFDRDEVANYMPCFKRFRDGECLWAEDHRLAQVYHEPLLCLSPAADSDMVCCGEETTTMGSLKIQQVTTASMNSNTRCFQEFEDMLLLTHGCSSYHHMSQVGDNKEAEF